MLTTSDGLTGETYGLLMRLKHADARRFDEKPAEQLVKLGYAAISTETGRLVATDEGKKIGFITRPAR